MCRRLQTVDCETVMCRRMVGCRRQLMEGGNMILRMAVSQQNTPIFLNTAMYDIAKLPV